VQERIARGAAVHDEGSNGKTEAHYQHKITMFHIHWG